MKKLFFILMALFCAVNIFAEEKDIFFFAEVDMELTEELMKPYAGKNLTEADLEILKTKTEKKVFPKVKFDAVSGKEIIESALVVENQSILDVSMIDEINFSQEQYTNYYYNIGIDFNQEGADNLYDFTLKNVGKNAAIIINGKVLFNAVIKQPIPGGKLELAGINSKADIEQFYNSIKDMDVKIKYPEYLLDKSIKEDLGSFNIYHIDYDQSLEFSQMLYAFINYFNFDSEIINSMLHAHLTPETEYNIKNDVVYVYEKECLLTRKDFKKIYVVETIPGFYGIIITLNDEGQKKWKTVLEKYKQDKFECFFMTYSNSGFMIDARSVIRDDEILIDYMFEDLARYMADELRTAIK